MIQLTYVRLMMIILSEKKIECYEYDVESRVLFLPNYSFEDKIFIKYDREVETMTEHSDSFTDKCESIFKI